MKNGISPELKISGKENFSSQVDGLNEQIKDVEDQLTRLGARYSQTQLWIENTTTEFEENEETIQELETSNLDRSGVLEERQTSCLLSVMSLSNF